MKYYKVIKENFLWEVGAILQKNTSGNGYEPIDDIFKIFPDTNEYISSNIVEKSPEYFQRVYKVDLVTRVVYETKDRAKEIISKMYKNDTHTE